MKPVSIRDLNTAAPVTDSHAGECATYRLAPSYRDTVTLDGKSNPAISRKVYYPRVKKLPDGSYFLVHMDMRLGGSIYASHSADLRHFTPRVALLAGMMSCATAKKTALFTPRRMRQCCRTAICSWSASGAIPRAIPRTQRTVGS